MIEDNKYVAFGVEAVKKEGFDVLEACHVGSRYITGGFGNDYDVLILVTKQEFRSGPGSHMFEDVRWTFDGSHPSLEAHAGDDGWGSWKTNWEDQEVNIIVTDEKGWYWDFIKAAEVCRFIHLVQHVGARKGSASEYDVRYGIHNILMDDSDADSEFERWKKEGK